MKPMTNSQYGARVRERESFNRAASRRLLGKDDRLHTMNVKRKAAKGVGRFADITKPLSSGQRHFIRERLRRATKEAVQREWIGANPFAEIRRRIFVK